MIYNTNTLTFNGICSADYDIFITGSATYNAPQRDIQMIEIPGRNGALTYDNKRYKNIVVTYPAFISRTFNQNFDAFRAAIMQSSGYQRLEDTYHPNEYRMGIFVGPIEADPTALFRGGEFDLEFNCKPQRFLKSGEQTKSFTATGYINNPTLFDAKPLIRCYGTGSFGLNGETVTISTAGTYTDIDCELMDCYRGTTNCNSNVTLTDFPTIAPGINELSISGFTQIDITPRWWTL